MCRDVLPPQSQPAGTDSWNVLEVLSGAALAVGLLTYYFALTDGDSSLVSRLTAAYPIISVALGYAVLGERPTPIQWCGIILVIVGTMLLLSPASTSARPLTKSTTGSPSAPKRRE